MQKINNFIVASYCMISLTFYYRIKASKFLKVFNRFSKEAASAKAAF